jgi:hypothetical protein
MTYLIRILTLLFSKLSINVIIVRQLLVKIYIKFGSGFCSINTTAHEVRQRARCHNCGVKGNNTYQIVYTGNSDLAMDGAGVRSD